MTGTRHTRRLAIAWALLAIGGCTSSSAPPVSSAPTDAPTHTTQAPAGNLPPGCEPIELRTPNGDLVDLNGVWVQDAVGNAEAMTWWIGAYGDCFWGTGIIDSLGEGFEQAHHVQSVRGTIRSDFTIDGLAALLGTHLSFENPQRSGEMRLVIEFDDAGEITLREDREPGVEGPRCPEPTVYCPAPLVLHPAP